MALHAKAPESNQFLFDLMDKLELVSVPLCDPPEPTADTSGCIQNKEELKTNEAVSDDEVAAAYVDNFSSKIFGQADAEDRSGKATRSARHSSAFDGKTDVDF